MSGHGYFLYSCECGRNCGHRIRLSNVQYGRLSVTQKLVAFPCLERDDRIFRTLDGPTEFAVVHADTLVEVAA